MSSSYQQCKIQCKPHTIKKLYEVKEDKLVKKHSNFIKGLHNFTHYKNETQDKNFDLNTKELRTFRTH